MAVIFDLLGVQSKLHGERGIARYVLQIAIALEAVDDTLVDTYLIRDTLPVPGSLEPLIRTGKVRTSKELAADPPASGVFIMGSPYELGENLDSILPTWCRRPSWRRTAILYDLIPLIYPDVYLHDEIKLGYMARTRTIASLDHLFAISEASKTDAVALLTIPPSSVTMIAAGADSQFSPPIRPITVIMAELRREFPTLRPDYVLFPSGIEWRKNVLGMLDAYAALPRQVRKRHQLVMVCSTNEHEREHLKSLTNERGITADFLATGFVEDRYLVQLYQASTLVVFPSLYEGFGLPVLEARRCGAAAICSDSSSLREVQPDPAARFDPLDPEAFAAKLHSTLTNPAEIIRLQNSTIPPFTWEWGAERMAPVIKRLHEQVACYSPRKRLAVVSPMPPQRSGIATYAFRLLEHLRTTADVTVFVDEIQEGTSVPEGVSVARTAELLSLERLDGRFDEVIYFIGNSHFHVEALEMLRQRPGVVLMHEARMTGLYLMQYELARKRLPGGTVGGFLQEWYPDKYRAHLYQEAVLRAPDADRFGVLLTREIAELATRVVTHSQYAADLIRLDSGVDVEVIFPHPIHAGTPARPKQDGPPVISSFGMVDPAKNPELLIRSLAIIRQTLPDATLRFLGQEADKETTEVLRALIKREQLEDAVVFTGHLTDDEFAVELASTTVAVQLRRFTNGESSGAVADLIGSGAAVVVTEIGAMAELPPEIVEFVSPSDGATELASCLLRLLGNTDMTRSMKENGRLYAIENSYKNAGIQLSKILFGSEETHQLDPGTSRSAYSPE